MTTTSRPGRSASRRGSRSRPLSWPEPQIEEGEVVRRVAQRLERGLASGGLRHLAAEPLEADGQRGADVPLVVDDEDAERLGGLGSHGRILA